jgi:type IV secretory pathway VirB6-like protein
MRAYWLAVSRHLLTAAIDVLFVALIGLMPILLGRLALVLGPDGAAQNYWAFLTNGQLAFFSMGSLATLLLICFRKKLPDSGTLWIGSFAVICLFFLMVLVGVDPSLQAAAAMVGRAALWLYILVLVVRILADAMKAVGPSDALEAGANASRRTASALNDRMNGGRP